MNLNRYFSLIFSSAIIVSIAGCSTLGPGDDAMKKSLQAGLPAYINVEDISFDKKENLGTDSDPSVQARFKSTLKLKEDTFERVFRPDLTHLRNPAQVTFIHPLEKQGKTVEMYGIALSKRFENSWKTDFKPDADPTLSLGKPRRFFEGKTVLVDSPEEKQLIADAGKQEIEDRKAAISKLFIKVNAARMTSNNPFTVSSFKIRFTSGNTDSQKLAGQLIFEAGTIKGFNGSLTDKELTFTTDKFVQGNDTFGLGTVYSIPLDGIDTSKQVIEGTWKRPNGQTGDLQIYNYST
jgi:hypothetical protein